MSGASPIRVLIVDDHALVRSGLNTFLLAYDDLEIVGEAASGPEAIRLIEVRRPDVVLMDLKLPGMSGAAATRAIRAAHPGVQVIALTSFPEEDLVREVLEAGATGYLLKDVSADDLAAAIRAAAQGEPALAPVAAQALVHAAIGGPPLGRDLSEREREVLALLVQGLDNAAIAERLGVSRATAKFHVSSILAKLGAANRGEAIALALQHRILP
jgi:two-component system, NarL family, response regulator LiaR